MPDQPSPNAQPDPSAPVNQALTAVFVEFGGRSSQVSRLLGRTLTYAVVVSEILAAGDVMLWDGIPGIENL